MLETNCLAACNLVPTKYNDPRNSDKHVSTFLMEDGGMSKQEYESWLHKATNQRHIRNINVDYFRSLHKQGQLHTEKSRGVLCTQNCRSIQGGAPTTAAVANGRLGIA